MGWEGAAHRARSWESLPVRRITPYPRGRSDRTHVPDNCSWNVTETG